MSTTDAGQDANPQEVKVADEQTDSKPVATEKTYTQDQLDDIIEGRLARERRNLYDSLRGNKDGKLKELMDSIDVDVIKGIDYSTSEDLEARAKRIADEEVGRTKKRAQDMLDSALKMRSEDISSTFRSLMKAKGASDKAIERESRNLLDDMGFDRDTGKSKVSVTDYVESLYNDSDMSYLFPNKEKATYKQGQPSVPAKALSGDSVPANLVTFTDWVQMDENGKAAYTRKYGMEFANA